MVSLSVSAECNDKISPSFSLQSSISAGSAIAWSKDQVYGCPTAKFGVRIPPGHRCLAVMCSIFLSGRNLYDELITHAEESYELWCVMSDLETI
jgi:hypothetical protein